MNHQITANEQSNADVLHLAFQGVDVRAIPDVSSQWIWMAGKDVFEAVGRSWYGARSCKNLPKEWVRVVKHATPQGVQDTYFLPHLAIYRLLIYSKTRPFPRLSRLIFAEVLPSLRADGYFGTFSVTDCIRMTDQHMKLVERLDSGSNAVVDALYPSYVDSCRRLRIEPLPIARFKDAQLEMEGL